jgi:hypothetical protein
VPADVKNAFAVTQGSWRFLDNDQVTPTALVEPLRDFARQQLGNTKYTLAVIDWSKLDYRKGVRRQELGVRSTSFESSPNF